jgi:hypothetical protein
LENRVSVHQREPLLVGPGLTSVAVVESTTMLVGLRGKEIIS